jgi:oleate hydratase
MSKENGKETIISVNSTDVVIVTLGSPNPGTRSGTNAEPPHYNPPEDDSSDGDWSLWFHLAQKHAKFGNPSNFKSNPVETMLVTFTITFKDSQFLKLYEELTKDVPGTGALVSLPQSNWLLSISVPHQPISPNQSSTTHVICGYGQHPERKGNFIEKPMAACSGEEITKELLGHLGFSAEMILPKSIAIPCSMPLATSALQPRSPNDRPEVIPAGTANVAFIGQFAEVPHDTTLSMDYSVRGALMAVHSLMGIRKSVPKVKGNLLVDIMDLLAE